jgi:hypothetical protein
VRRDGPDLRLRICWAGKPSKRKALTQEVLCSRKSLLGLTYELLKNSRRWQDLVDSSGSLSGEWQEFMHSSTGDRLAYFVAKPRRLLA